MYVLTLPDDVLEKILSYVTYDEVSRCRLVCQRFNDISKRILNRGFHKVEIYHSQCSKKLKSQLPRRESERRAHPLSRHCDILNAIETRLSLLDMTFKTYISRQLCCFIPGKVLDEIFNVLRYVITERSPLQTHEVMRELRDLSSMATEYFDENIAPALQSQIPQDDVPKITVFYNAMRQQRPSTSRQLQIHPMDRLNRRQNKFENELNALRVMRKEDQEDFIKRLGDLEQFAVATNKKLNKSEKAIGEQQLTITTQGLKINAQQLQIKRLNKLVERCLHKLSSKKHRKKNKKRRNIDVNEIACTSDSVVNEVKCASDTVISEVKCTLDSVVNEVQCTLDSVDDEVKCTLDSIVNEVTCTLDSVVNDVTCTLDSVVNEVQCTLDSVDDEVKCIPDSVDNEVKCIQDSVYNEVKCTPDSVYNEIKCTRDSAVNEIKYLLDSLKTFKRKLQNDMTENEENVRKRVKE